MKIIFICGSLEPGRDGVGDYTRRLACELIRQGNLIAVLALYDRSINGIIMGKQDLEGVNIKVLRLGANESPVNRFFYAQKWIEKLNPEWLSLQYVPFSFHNKGLPWSLAKKLKKLDAGRNWHIMFHELWIGMNKEDSIRHKILGGVQKHIIKKTIDVLVPRIIHTHTRLYRAQLDKMGYKSERLALFGNIPKIFQSEVKSNDLINIAVFGGIHQGAKLQKWLKNLPKTSKYEFHFIGNNGPEQARWIEILTKNNLDHQLYGWLGIGEISNILSKCQWGLTSTPYYLSEKSGSTAAMLEHNLIVFCIARKWKPRNIKFKALSNGAVIKWNSNLEFESFMSNKRCNSGNNIEVIAENFIYGLKTNQV